MHKSLTLEKKKQKHQNNHIYLLPVGILAIFSSEGFFDSSCMGRALESSSRNFCRKFSKQEFNSDTLTTVEKLLFFLSSAKL